MAENKDKDELIPGGEFNEDASTTAADRLGDQLTALARSARRGIRPQARAKGVDRFTSSTNAAKQAARPPNVVLKNRRFFCKAFFLFSALFTA